MINRKMLLLIAASGLLTACNDSSSNTTNVLPPADPNGGLSVAGDLSGDDLALFAKADFQERLALPAFSNRSNGQMPLLNTAFDGVADLSNALDSVNDDCATGVMDYKARTYDASWECSLVQGTAHIFENDVEIHLKLQGLTSSADINHVYSAAGDLSAFVINRSADDSFEIGNNVFDVDGNTSATFSNLGVNEIVDTAIAGSLNVSKNGAAAQVITITSDDVGYYVDENSGVSHFCDGSVTYSTASGAVLKLDLPACESSPSVE